MRTINTLCSIMIQYYNTDRMIPLVVTHRSDDFSEGRTPPAPDAVGDNVGRVGGERGVVCVELARVVRSTVIVRVTDR